MPFGNEIVVIRGGGMIVIARDFVAVVFILSVTWKVTEIELPAVVGIPEITPPPLSDNPKGNVPDVMVQA